MITGCIARGSNFLMSLRSQVVGVYIYSIFGFSLYAWPLLLGYEEDMIVVVLRSIPVVSLVLPLLKYDYWVRWLWFGGVAAMRCYSGWKVRRHYRQT